MKHRIKPISFEGWKKELNPINHLVLMELINIRINSKLTVKEMYKDHTLRDFFKQSLKY